MSERRMIVCGGRDYEDHATIERVLASYSERVTLVHGDCPTGADALAWEIWASWGRRQEPHPADWEQFGKSAGPRRNEKMAKLGADVCIAFPGGRGTANMITNAKAAGIPVLRVETS